MIREREKIMITRLEVNETNNMIEHETWMSAPSPLASAFWIAVTPISTS